MDYIIRKIKKEDSTEVTHVITVAWNETYKGIVPDDVLEELYTNEKERAKRLSKAFDEDEVLGLVLEVDNKIVGISYYGTAKDTDYDNCGEIRALYIINKYHGYGFGKKLVEESIKELKKMGFNKMIICCLRDNINANKFYEHIGGKYVKDGVYERLNLPEKIYYYEKI